MTPFRGESSTWASVWPGGSESTVVGAVCPVIVDAIVGRLSEKAAVIHSWLLWHPGPIPLVCVCLSRCCAGCLALALAAHVCAGCHLITGGCTALLAALPQWPRGWSQAVQLRAWAAGTGVAYGRPALQLQPTPKTAE